MYGLKQLYLTLLLILLTQSNLTDGSDKPSGTVANESTSQLASQHFHRVIKEAKCERPVAKVIHLSDYQLSAKKKFVPHCTLLHFCGHFSGCCRQENEECVAKTQEDVKLYFWVIELTADGKQHKSVEHITMVNHTECHCQPINYDTPR